MYDKHGFILRVETTTNDVTFFRHHRMVEQRDGKRVMKLAYLKKSIYSLCPDLLSLSRAANDRYIQFLSTAARRCLVKPSAVGNPPAIDAPAPRKTTSRHGGSDGIATGWPWRIGGRTAFSVISHVLELGVGKPVPRGPP
jgi:hypothetical protein